MTTVRNISAALLVLALALVLATMLPARARQAPDAGNEVLLFALNGGLDALRLHSGSATQVSPQWFAAEADGRLAGVPARPLLDACRELKIPVTPAVFNRDFSPDTAKALLDSRPARARLVRELLARAKRFRFRGYVIDFENLPADEIMQRRLNDFLGEVRTSFAKARLSLAVAVPPPSARNRQAFDYAAIGRMADRVVLMAYDQHGRFSDPGPIAGYGWVDATLRDTVQLVPARKLLLGIAFYHRNWGDAGATSGSYSQAVMLQRESGADWRWDATHRAHWFGFVREGQLHTVWVEDAASIADKLALARKHGLAGIAGWRLGQEDPRVWVMLQQFRNN